jgi:hypothetical protein
MRSTHFVSALAILILAVSAADAQTTATPRFFADVNAAATLGHKSDSAFGGEFGMLLTPGFDVIAEGGHMGNVGTSDLDDRAQLIASAIGATVGATAEKVNFFDAGFRYRVPINSNKWTPWVALGFGVADVKSEVAFSVNPDEAGVQLGPDLSGSVMKALLMFGLGGDVYFAKRYFAGLSYRYGHIFPRSGIIEDDVAIKTQRVQGGVGIRF